MSTMGRINSLAVSILVLSGVLCAYLQNANSSGAGPQTNAVRRIGLTGSATAGMAPVRTASRIPGPTVPDGLGVNIHWTNPRPGEMRMLAATGVRWIRMDFAWGATETTKGQYNFAHYSRLITALRRYHIRPVLILNYGNPLYEHGAFPTTTVARHAFAKWAATAVNTFRGYGVMWEMYNEPNGMGHATPAQYAKLAIEVGRAIHKADPHALYVGPALAGMDRPWLKQILQDGVLKEFDAITVHPYRQTPPETVVADYANFRKLIARYSPPGRVIPLISGEWGYSTTWMKRNANRQGKYLVREFLTNLMCRIPLSIWYDWHNDGAFGLGHLTAGSIEITHIAISNGAGVTKPPHLLAKGHKWTFWNGAEFPGAKGSFKIIQDHQTPVGLLNYNFAGGGNYVDAGVNVAIKKAGTLVFKVKSAHRQSVLVRVVDHSGQCLQFYRRYSKIGHWQPIAVNLHHGSSSHWGGKNNGVLDFPITSISIGVNNSFPSQERHFGIVKYKYHPHRHWVYTPKPAFFACRTLTHTLCGFHFEKRIKERNSNDFVLVFAHGKRWRWVAWSVVKPKAGRGVIILSLPTGTYRVINYLGAEHITTKVGAAGLKLQLSTGPQYILPQDRN
ncbi:MAG: cellulase family glycosylhydrolase [Phycisphaerae bacterium]